MRAPLLLFPLVLSALADALVSFGRISNFLTAEELKDSYHIDASQSLALYLDGDFAWETVLKLDDAPEKPLTQAEEIEKLRKEAERKKADRKRAKEAKKQGKPADSDEKSDEKQGILPTHTDDLAPETQVTPEEIPFSLTGVHMEIKKGAFVAIVGPIGCGKVSICLLWYSSILIHIQHRARFYKP